MGQVALVDEQIADGRRFVERFAADGNTVQAAFWVKTAEEGDWFLYVVTDIYDRDGPAAAYRSVHRSLGSLQNSLISSSEIKVIGPKNPIAKDAVAIMARFTGRMATWFGGKSLGSMLVEQIYLYPRHIFTFTRANPMTTEDINRKLIELMNRGPGVWQPHHVGLKDGTSFEGSPISLGIGPNRSVEVSFIEDGAAAPRVIRLDEIDSIG